MAADAPQSVTWPRGLYDPGTEHDACGIGAVININGQRDHTTIETGKQVLLNLHHRGAAGADETTGDGAGILMQMPHEFFAEEAGRLDVKLPAPGRYAVASLFAPLHDADCRAACEQLLAEAVDVHRDRPPVDERQRPDQVHREGHREHRRDAHHLQELPGSIHPC